MQYIANSLSDIAEKYLKDRILDASLKSGDKIIEKEVADALQISRAPVREALRSLSEQGLITYSPRRGHCVLEMPREEIFEVFQIRITLELQVLKILVSNRMLQPHDFEELRGMTTQMKHAGEHAKGQSQEVYLLNSLDIAFHKYLWSASRSIRRCQLLESLFFQLLIVMNNNIASLGSCNEKAEEHFLLIESLQTNQVGKVCAELRRHLDKYIIAALGGLSPSEEDLLEAVFKQDADLG